MNRKFLGVLLSLLMIVGILSACSSQTSTDTTTITKRTQIDVTESQKPVESGTESEKESGDTATQVIQHGLKVHFIDVGQADAALLISGDSAMLIDGGNVGDSSRIYSYLDRLGISHLDYIVGTHAHEDHMGGLSGALQKASVGVIYAPKTENDAKFYQSFKNKVASAGKSITHPDSGTSFNLGSCSVELYCPTYENEDDLNNTSIITKVVCGDTSFLFTGDAEYSEEHDILSQGYDLSATVLKAGHHGSDTSSSYQFLREVMPEYVVISVGKGNQYGHPDEDALSRFRDAGAKVYRTDLQGDIIVESNGKDITVTTARNENIETNPTSYEHENVFKETESTGTYIGNKNSKKFHKPTCHSLPIEKNRVYFSSRADAVNSGYDSCGNCHP